MQFFSIVLFSLISFLISCTSKAGCPPIPAEPQPMPPHVPAPPSHEPPFPDLESYLKAEINEARRINGAPMIVATPQLDCAALMHANDMAAHEICNHNGSDGSRFWERAKKCGTRAAAEIIGCGHDDFKQLVDAWLKDKAHRDILLDKKNIAMGAARVGTYWVVIFRK